MVGVFFIFVFLIEASLGHHPSKPQQFLGWRWESQLRRIPTAIDLREIVVVPADLHLIIL